MTDQHEENEGSGIWGKLKLVFYAGIVIWVLFSWFGNRDSTPKEPSYEEVTEYSPTEGLITTVDEVQAEVFKISDEEVIPKKEDSRIIAKYMNGAVDTFTLEEVALVDTTITDRNDNRYQRRFMRSVIFGGAMGYMMGRSMSRPLSRGSYRSDAAYNKSNSGARTRMRSTASSRTVRKPVARKSGFGSRKSTRSYGG